MEYVSNEATVWDSEDEIQPEGGLSLDDLSEDEKFSALDGDGTGTEVERIDAEDREPKEPNGEEAHPAPTPEQEAESAEGEGTEATPTPEEPKQPEQNKLKFKVKIDRKEENVELDSSDLPALYQRGQNYDRLENRFKAQSERLTGFDTVAKQLGYKSLEDMMEQASQQDRESRIAELTEAGTARSIAEDFVDRAIAKMRQDTAEQEAEISAAEVEEEPAAKAKEKAPLSFEQQVEAFFKVRPELKGNLRKLPDEVSKAVVEGGLELRTAYAEWEARQMKAENERIRKEKDIFAQQAETAARAPVRGAIDNKVGEKDKPDPFIKAFWDDIY